MVVETVPLNRRKKAKDGRFMKDDLETTFTWQKLWRRTLCVYIWHLLVASCNCSSGVPATVWLAESIAAAQCFRCCCHLVLAT